jgi:hypothetical protein
VGTAFCCEKQLLIALKFLSLWLLIKDLALWDWKNMNQNSSR